MSVRWREDLHPRRADGQFGAGPADARQATRAVRAAQVATSGRVTTTPPALPEGVETIPLTQLRAQLKHSADNFDYTGTGWDDVLARQVAISTTPAFLADILRNGMQPIRVTTAEHNGPLRDADEIRDGNHRLAAAALLGITDVPVTRRDLADDSGANKVRVTAGPPIGPLPPGAGAVLARAKELLALPDPGHRALQEAETERQFAAYEARQEALAAEAEAEEARFRARRAGRR